MYKVGDIVQRKWSNDPYDNFVYLIGRNCLLVEEYDRNFFRVLILETGEYSTLKIIGTKYWKLIA